MKPVWQYTLTVTLEEDLHSGTGLGNTQIDDLQARDREGRPVIRATHFKGLLKESAQELEVLGKKAPEVIKRLFGGEGPNEMVKTLPTLKEVIEGLFGGEGPGKRGCLLLTSLRRPQAERFLHKTSTARQINSRVPLEDTLRTVEYVGASTSFEATLQLRNPSPEQQKRLEWCLQRTTCLGSGRTHGDGLIQMEWPERGKELKPESEREARKPPSDQDRPRLRLFLRNLEPLCLPLTGYPGNIIPSESYIRGSTLAGALADWALTLEERGKSVESLFDRQILVGNALPLPFTNRDEIKRAQKEDLQRWEVIPIPLHIRTRKVGQQDQNWPWWAEESSGPVPWLGSQDEDDSFHKKPRLDQSEKPKRPKDNEFLFRSPEQDTWQRFKPAMGVHLRNRVEDERLFSEEEIAEDTLFLCDLHFPDNKTAQDFVETFALVLSGAAWLAVGRGGRAVEILRHVWLPPLTAAKPAETGQVREPVSSFILLLESDLIARAIKPRDNIIPNLGYYDKLDPWALAELVGLDGTGCKWSYDPPVSETVGVYGFNAASGWPRPAAFAIRRGSVLQVKGEGAGALHARLAQRLADNKPLGERTWEGFGRFRLLADESFVKRPPELKSSEETPHAKNPREAILAGSYDLLQSLSGENKKRFSKNLWQYLRQEALRIQFQIQQDEASELTKEENIAKLLNNLKEREKRANDNKQSTLTDQLEESLKEKDKKELTPLHVCLFLDTLARWRLAELEESGS